MTTESVNLHIQKWLVVGDCLLLAAWLARPVLGNVDLSYLQVCLPEGRSRLVPPIQNALRVLLKCIHAFACLHTTAVVAALLKQR